MRYFLRYLRRDADQWSALIIILSLCIAVPLLMVLWHLPEGPGELWPHIRTYLLPTYVSNSLLLLGGTSVGCILLGVPSAWIVSRYSFPGRRTIAWLLLLPLAIPSYIMAYAYVGLSESLSSYSLRLDFMNLPGLIWVLSLALYPYVYGGCRALFQHFPRNLQDSSYMLGATEAGFFFRVALPLATPAILAGIFLVSMEVLNDYGAAKYYGVNTFTTGIFRTWTALEDLPAAIYLAAILIVLVGILMALLKWLRDRRNYAVKASTNQGEAARLPLRGRLVLIGLPLVLLPLVCGFVLPVVQLGHWTWRSFELSFLQELLEVSLQSFAVAAAGAGSVCLLALLLLFSSRWNALHGLGWFTRLAVVGYALPGAIIGIGIISGSQVIIDFFYQLLAWKVGFLFYGSFYVLIYAYVFRFLAVAYHPLEAATLALGGQSSEAAYLLGSSRLRTAWRVELPLLRSSLLGAFVLVFIDVLKELPLTLILKPYYLRTLATEAYAYADDEQVIQAALPALLLILVVGTLMFLVNQRFSTNVTL